MPLRQKSKLPDIGTMIKPLKREAAYSALWVTFHMKYHTSSNERSKYWVGKFERYGNFYGCIPILMHYIAEYIGPTPPTL